MSIEKYGLVGWLDHRCQWQFGILRKRGDEKFQPIVELLTPRRDWLPVAETRLYRAIWSWHGPVVPCPASDA